MVCITVVDGKRWPVQLEGTVPRTFPMRKAAVYSFCEDIMMSADTDRGSSQARTKQASSGHSSSTYKKPKESPSTSVRSFQLPFIPCLLASYLLTLQYTPIPMLSVKTLLALLTVAASASAAALFDDVVVITPITAPDAGDVWPVGSVQTITWDTTTIPAGSEDATGFVLLGYLEDGSSDEHLDLRK